MQDINNSGDFDYKYMYTVYRCVHTKQTGYDIKAGASF